VYIYLLIDIYVYIYYVHVYIYIYIAHIYLFIVLRPRHFNHGDLQEKPDQVGGPCIYVLYI